MTIIKAETSNPLLNKTFVVQDGLVNMNWLYTTGMNQVKNKTG